MTGPAMSSAQKVFAAWRNASDGHYEDGEWIQHSGAQLAAALCAFADEVVPDEGHTLPIHHPSAEWFRFDERKKVRAQFLAIAAELENPQP
jgi:hypothetical protein